MVFLVCECIIIFQLLFLNINVYLRYTYVYISHFGEIINYLINAIGTTNNLVTEVWFPPHNIN